MRLSFRQVVFAALGLLATISAAFAQVSIPFPGPGLTTFTFATFDPATLTGGGSLSGGNLTYSSSGSASVVRTTKYATSTKFYVEVTVNTATSGSGNIALGVVSNAQGTTTPSSIASVPSGMWLMRNDALALNNGSSSSYGGNWGAGTALSVAVDNTLGSGSGKVWIGTCSGGTISWYNSGDPVAGTNSMFSNLSGNIGIIVNSQTGASHGVTLNAGASAFSCTAPSGYGLI